MVGGELSEAFTGPMHGSLGEHHGFTPEGMSRLGVGKDRRELKLLKTQNRPMSILQSSESDSCGSSLSASTPPLRVEKKSDTPVTTDGYGFSFIPVGACEQPAQSQRESQTNYHTNSMGFSSIPIGAPSRS